VWLQIKADILGTTFEAIDCEEPTSLGAAMLAATLLVAPAAPALPVVLAVWLTVGGVALKSEH